MRTRLSACASAAAVGLAVLSAQGGTIYTTGFENPPFTPGPLASAPLASGQDGWFYDDTNSGNTNIVSGTTAAGTTFAGTQALRVVADPGTNYIVRSTPVTPTTSLPVVTLGFAMKLESSTTSSFGWGGSVLDNGGANAAELAAFSVRADGTINANNGTVGQAVTASGFVPRDVWRTYTMTMNFQAGTWQLAVNGSTVTFGASGSNLALYFSPSYAGGISEFDLINRPGAATGVNDSARFDSYSIVTSAVPEPAGLAACLAATGLLGRRQRASSSN